jgi:hypothetical protein
MNAIEPEEYPDDTQKAEILADHERALEGNNFDEPLEDLKESSESYSILLGLVTIETKLISRSLTRKKRSAEPTDDLRSVVDDRT